MEKPLKLLHEHDANDEYIKGYNLGLDVSEAYYKQHIEENYIRKDALKEPWKTYNPHHYADSIREGCSRPAFGGKRGRR